MKLNVAALALAFGICWGIGVFIMTWWLIVSGSVAGELSLLERFYPGFSVTPVGSIAGLVWGFFDGLICGAIIAWLYNFFAGRVSVGKRPSD